MAVQAEDVADPVVALRVSLEPVLHGAIRGNRLALDPSDVERLPRLDRLDVARELLRDVAGRDELRRPFADLLDVCGFEVIGMRMRDEDHVGGVLLGSQPPGVDIHRDPLALPLIGGLLVPRELLEHRFLLVRSCRRLPELLGYRVRRRRPGRPAGGHAGGPAPAGRCAANGPGRDGPRRPEYSRWRRSAGAGSASDRWRTPRGPSPRCAG